MRQHTTASSLWSALRSHVNEGAWDVVSRVALQLHDRNVEDGADDVLSHAIRDGELEFAARALGYLTPRPDVVRGIAIASLRRAVATPHESRTSYSAFNFILAGDFALESCLSTSLPANRDNVRRAVAEDAARLYDERHTGIPVLVRGLLGCPDVDAELRSELHDIYWRAPDGDSPRAPWPWLRDMDDLTDLHTLVALRGTHSLFEHVSFLGEIIPAPVTTLLSPDNARSVDQAEARRLAVQITRSKQPWISYNAWILHHDLAMPLRLAPRGELCPDLEFLLCLPYLEAFVDFGFGLPFAPPPDLSELAESRAVEPSGAAYPWTPPGDMSEAVADLLSLWTTRDFNVFE